MSIAEFESLSLTVCVGGLIAFMLFIVYDLAKTSKAGRFGTAILFMGLGLGILGFSAKSLIQFFVHV